MKMFGKYLEQLDNTLSQRPIQNVSENRLYNNILVKSNQSNITAAATTELSTISGPKVLIDYDRSIIENFFGKNKDAFEKITIGAHPDFSEIPSKGYINHHCVSVFIDIKGSTKLIEKYSLLEVRLIKDSLLTLAIQVASQFGGHIHRLQGDGIFIQFVRRDQLYNDSIINALNATSILMQFVSNDLAEMLKSKGIRPLKLRVGIDFGDTNDVIWSHYGIPGCSELTTTSLHTDMAAKLQAKAYDNSILIGDNVRKYLDLKEDFYDYYRNEESKELVYNISNTFTYKFFVFDWKDYLLSLPYYSQDANHNLYLHEKKYTLECFLIDEKDETAERYYPNSKSIPKGKKIRFKIFNNGIPYVKASFENIEWNAFNSGEEAKTAREERHDFGKKFNNSTLCETAAAYLGHHYVECKIVRPHSDNIKIKFPLFVQ